MEEKALSLTLNRLIDKERDEIISEVAAAAGKEFSVSAEMLMYGKSRKLPMPYRRGVFYYCVVEFFDVPAAYLANHLKMNHSTILHHRDQIRVLVKYDPDTKRIIEKIKSHVKKEETKET